MKRTFIGEYADMYPSRIMLLILCLIICAFSMIEPFINLSTITAFNVDSDGLVYVGYPDRIVVYGQGRKIRSVSIPATNGRDYAIDVSEAPDIRAYIGGNEYHFNQEGRMVKKTANGASGIDVHSAAKGPKVVGNTVYKIKGIVWPRIVIKGGKTVFRLSIVGVLIRILRVIGACGFFIIFIGIAKAKADSNF